MVFVARIIFVHRVEFQDQPGLISQAISMGSFGQVSASTHPLNTPIKYLRSPFKFLGGTIGLGIAEPVFASELYKYLAKYAPTAPVAIVKQSPCLRR